MGPTTGDKQQIAQRLAGDLIGTTDLMPEEFEDDLDVLEHFDDLAFRCSICDWWCCISEEASGDADLDEYACQQCVDDL